LALDPDARPIRATGFGLFNDTLTAGDLKSTDPTLTAAIEGDLAGGYVHVEFDRDSDGAAEAFNSAAEAGDRIFYDPRLVKSELSALEHFRHRVVNWKGTHAGLRKRLWNREITWKPHLR